MSLAPRTRGRTPPLSNYCPIRLRVPLGPDGEATVTREVARLHARGLAAHINGELVPGRPELRVTIQPIEPDVEIYGPFRKYERVIRPAPDPLHPDAQRALRHAVARAKELGHEAVTLGEWVHSRRCPARVSGDWRRCRCEPRATTRTMSLATAQELLILGGVQ